ncbi:MAG: Uma2 family endonuclease [Eubacterium sp.]|nr:Uma2 family endonuclease [Eubacterium sp.]
MTIKEMINLKKEMGLSYQDIADMSGVPLGTVQKVFTGVTTSPRRSTIEALTGMFEKEKKRTGYEYFRHMDFDAVEENAFYGSTAVKIDSYENKTLEDYLALPEGTRIELIDGTFYDMAAPTFVHQRVGAMIFNVFENFVNANGGPCIPSVAPTDVQLDSDDKTMVQPDVLVVCDRNKIIKARVVGAPDLIVEVLSEGNWFHDTVRKLAKYRNAGVREYWIVVPEEKKVLVYIFAESPDAVTYSFDDKVPVGIWDGKCIVDFHDIYDKISFLMER